jgi:transposase
MLTPLGQSEGVIKVEDWAEIRRLSRSEHMGVKTIARRLGLARNTVRSALAADASPKYSRAPQGSRVDEFEPAIRGLLTEFPEMPASVIAERIGWEHSSSVLRARVALLRPLFSPPDPADRTTYAAGEIVQCDLWFPGEVVPVAPKVFANPPVLTMVATYSGFMMALLLPSRQAGDLVAGMWQLLAGLGGVPKMLVWDNEPGIGQRRRLTLSARSFAGTLGTRIYQAAPRDPETKGVIERANGFFETSFMPGRTFTSPGDYNTQLAEWLPRANARMLRRTGQRPGVLIDEDVAAMGALPPVAPIAIKAAEAAYPVAFNSATGWITRLADAHDHGRLEVELRRLNRYRLIVIDEVGYLPFDAASAALFFQLIASRYETGSVIVTSNLAFSRWGETLGDDVVAAPTIDRLVHHAHVIPLDGDSYRTRAHRAGPPPAAPKTTK